MLEKVTLTNVKIGYTNFAGRPSRYNAKYNRNFVVYLNDEDTLMLRSLGCPVKTIKANEEKNIPELHVVIVRVLYDSQVYIPELVPKICIKFRGGQEKFLGEKDMSIMDSFDVYKANLHLNVYHSTPCSVARLYLVEGHFKVKKKIDANKLLRVMGI